MTCCQIRIAIREEAIKSNVLLKNDSNLFYYSTFVLK